MTLLFNLAEITAVILAGGEGKRLDGRDKGLQILDGKPLIAHVVAALAAQVGKISVCINRNHAHYAAFATTYIDRTAGFQGPLAGIDTALTACDTGWLLTVPVDCPQPPADLAQRLRAAVHGTHVRAAVAHDGTRRQPLFALYRRELGFSTASALAANLPVWRWQDDCGGIEVDFSDVPQAFINLNTVDDFRRWEQNHRD